MNIGVDIRPLMTAPRTGVGEYTYELLDAILKIDRENQYFLFFNSWSDVSKNIPAWEYGNIKFVAKHFPNKLLNGAMRLLGFPRLDSVCGKVDVFFSPNLNFTAVSRNTKFILTVHDLSYKFFPEFSTAKQFWWHKAVAPKKQCRRADLILTPSENTKRDIVNFYKINPEKIKVIYPGAVNCLAAESKEEIRKKYSLPDKYILFLGTIEPRKNIIGLIESFEQTKGDLFLVIAGAPGWKNKEILERAKRSEASARIKFLGFVPAKDKPALYAGARAFIYPSIYEGFGFPVLEAMGAGVPVITSNRSSIPEITGTTAYLIDPTRPDQLTRAMDELTHDEILSQWHSVRGREQAKKFYWQKAANEWLNCVRDLYENRN